MQAKAKTGCGCGGGCGGGGRAGGGCQPARLPEAAAAVCSSCETQSFVRPRFFAGQLLTEDDLGALTDYIVGKNRFHNARLFGAGVVCGLAVERGPCDGQLVIEPGYALDCCGNDLVLTCAQTLDIAPLIRELAAHKDCGCTDPCLPTSSAPSAGDAPRGPCRHYCLYARYAERSDQPVAAYPVAGACDAASCEPTRIVEGIVFELRCPPARPARPATFRDAASDGEPATDECPCAAVHPPCPACDDTGVLLACIDVDRCKVVRICNRVRQFVLAPTTLRYWDAIAVPGPAECCGRDEYGQRAGRASDVTRQTPAPAATERATERANERANQRELAELRARLAELARRIADLERPDLAARDPAKPAAEQPEAAKPAAEQRDPAKPAAEQPEAARPAAEQPEATKPAAEQPEAAKQPDPPRPAAVKPTKSETTKSQAARPTKEKP